MSSGLTYKHPNRERKRGQHRYAKYKMQSTVTCTYSPFITHTVTSTRRESEVQEQLQLQLSACLPVDHECQQCRTNQVTVLGVDLGGPKKPCVGSQKPQGKRHFWGSCLDLPTVDILNIRNGDAASGYQSAVATCCKLPIQQQDAPLRVCNAVQRHQSPGRPTLCQISSLIYPKMQRRQINMNVLHPSCVWLPWWSPPVLWKRFKDGLVSICVLIHSCKMPKESETTGLNDA